MNFAEKVGTTKVYISVYPYSFDEPVMFFIVVGQYIFAKNF